jgi:hypothetical protein
MEVYYTPKVNTQLLITVHNSSRILTQVQLVWVLEYNSQITLRQVHSYLFAFQHTTVDYSSSMTHVHSLLVFSHNCPTASKSLPYIAHSVSIVTSPSALLRYYGNATNSLSRNSNCHVTMETPQNVSTLLWKCHKVHRSCYQVKPNMSQYGGCSLWQT